ncbi:UNKNOWN [Stylonychia lemnae]|uniref:Uncharacterized protein n=1 Tax=Stylonychia lemnae TaxID=5949 RepID=A0A078AKY2_STYLE|nr:UNKNOWN [Stylonychia lemnae]|eukprot:CDW82541.1 UNKNOWN [Stylonychia lemnae]
MNCQPAVDTSSPQTLEKIKHKLMSQNQKDQKRREDLINRENMRIFLKINEVVEYGPKSLNFLNKKQEIRKIVQENEMLKNKIASAKSFVSRTEIIQHQSQCYQEKSGLEYSI